MTNNHIHRDTTAMVMKTYDGEQNSFLPLVAEGSLAVSKLHNCKFSKTFRSCRPQGSYFIIVHNTTGLCFGCLWGGSCHIIAGQHPVKIYKTQYFRSFRDILIDGFMLDTADKEIISPFSCDYSDVKREVQ